MQLYRGMDIGTAKLTPAERRGVPAPPARHLGRHGDGQRGRVPEAGQAAHRRRSTVPVLVGGSGLYVRAAIDDLEFPGTDPEIRARLEAELAERGPAPLYERLREPDPAGRGGDPAEQRAPHRARAGGDRALGPPVLRDHAVLSRRSTRACRSGWRCPGRSSTSGSRSGSSACGRPGWSTEVRGLLGQGLAEGRTASRALGYAQVMRFLPGSGPRSRRSPRRSGRPGGSPAARSRGSAATRGSAGCPYDAPDLLERSLARIAGRGSA